MINVCIFNHTLGETSNNREKRDVLGDLEAGVRTIENDLLELKEMVRKDEDNANDLQEELKDIVKNDEDGEVQKRDDEVWSVEELIELESKLNLILFISIRTKKSNF